MTATAHAFVALLAAGCGLVEAEPPRDAGVDGRAGLADATQADAPTCAELAVNLCGRIAACPAQETQVLCYEASPDGACFGSLDECVAAFTSCHPTATPPAGRLTFIPDPAACLAALPSVVCQQGGPLGSVVTLPTSCVYCSLPDGSLMTGMGCAPVGDGG